MEIGLLAAAACGAGLQNLFQGGGGAKSGTVCGFERSGAGWRMPASLCSSELREGVTNTGLLVTRLAWMAFGEISSQLFKYIYSTKLASSHSLSVCPGGTGQQRF